MSNVSVVPDDGRSDSPPLPGTLAQAPIGSPLSDLRKRIKDNRRKRTLDLRVPGLDDIYVRFQPMASEFLAMIDEKYAGEKAEPNDIPPSLRMECESLIHCCLGIFQEVDGSLVSIDPETRCYVNDDNEIVGEAVTFTSVRLAELIGTPEGGWSVAIRNVLCLYGSDGDVHATGRRLTAFSGFLGTQIHERPPGN